MEGSGEIQTFTLRSKLFRKAMKLLGIRLEYIQKQTPEDNGNIESFHNSIKTDYIWPVDISNFQEGKDIIDHAFRDYNEKRPHSSILFLSPREFRKRWDSDPEFRLEYKNCVKKMKDKAMVKRKNNKRMEVEIIPQEEYRSRHEIYLHRCDILQGKRERDVWK